MNWIREHRQQEWATHHTLTDLLSFIRPHSRRRHEEPLQRNVKRSVSNCMRANEQRRRRSYQRHWSWALASCRQPHHAVCCNSAAHRTGRRAGSNWRTFRPTHKSELWRVRALECRWRRSTCSAGTSTDRSPQCRPPFAAVEWSEQSGTSNTQSGGEMTGHTQRRREERREHTVMNLS
jgi:hypothetical protein